MLQDLATDGVPVWVVAVVAVAIFVAQAVPRVLGPLGSGIAEWAQRRRQAAIDKDDADLADLRRQIDYARQRLDADRDELLERDRLIQDHRVWDRLAMEAVPDLPPPPRLWPDPTNPPTEE